MFVIIIQCVNLVLLMIQRFPDSLDKEDFVKGVCHVVTRFFNVLYVISLNSRELN